MKNYQRIIQMFVIFFLCFANRNVQAQLVVTASTNYVQLVDSFSLSGITTSNINYTGTAAACGYFSNGNSTNLGIDNGIILSTGYAADVDNGAPYFGSSNLISSGNSLLTSLTGGNTYDAAMLEFDIVPAYDTLSFSFVYGAEDYPEWVGGNALYQDHIGAFISGTNPSGGSYSNQNFVFVPNTNLPVIVNNINATTNSQYYVNNITGSVMFDGFTILLQVKIPVVAAAAYHLTIGIADGGDQISDAGVFLKSHSLLSYGNNTGISELDKKDVFHFYPNPATNKIIFMTTANGTLTITNQLGQFVNVANIKDNQTLISTDNLPSGIYFMTFQTEKSFVTRKLIIQ